MTQGLERFQSAGDLHFVTFSCYRRQPLLGSPAARDQFEASLERMRLRYGFFLRAYVVMPEHVHLLISEPTDGVLATALQAVKLSVTRRREERPFWLKRYYDFNVFTRAKVLEKMHYIHMNPVSRGLVAQPKEWAWSSCRHFLTGAKGVVEVESEWLGRERERASSRPLHVSEARRGAPKLLRGVRRGPPAGLTDRVGAARSVYGRAG